MEGFHEGEAVCTSTQTSFEGLRPFGSMGSFDPPTYPSIRWVPFTLRHTLLFDGFL